MARDGLRMFGREGVLFAGSHVRPGLRVRSRRVFPVGRHRLRVREIRWVLASNQRLRLRLAQLDHLAGRTSLCLRVRLAQLDHHDRGPVLYLRVCVESCVYSDREGGTNALLPESDTHRLDLAGALGRHGRKLHDRFRFTYSGMGSNGIVQRCFDSTLDCLLLSESSARLETVHPDRGLVHGQQLDLRPVLRGLRGSRSIPLQRRGQQHYHGIPCVSKAAQVQGSGQ